mmetsp:Transcript_20183/g.42725  ORF Transcript_20183/g.42725 Transcript_20183/m.42725 type:complete len:115 (-) Transcript_20183:106-450(-)
MLLRLPMTRKASSAFGPQDRDPKIRKILQGVVWTIFSEGTLKWESVDFQKRRIDPTTSTLLPFHHLWGLGDGFFRFPASFPFHETHLVGIFFPDDHSNFRFWCLIGQHQAPKNP